MNIEDFSPRLLSILEVAAQKADQESAILGERHLMHGFLTIGGGLTGALLSLLQVDLSKMTAWLEDQNPFDEDGRVRVEHLDYEAKELCQQALAEARYLQHASIKIAHLLLASTEVSGGYVSAFWQGRTAEPQQIGEAIRHELREEEISLDMEMNLSRGYLSSNLQRLIGLAWHARAVDNAPAVTVHHLFRAFSQLDRSELAVIPRKLRKLLHQVRVVLLPHPLFAPDGFLDDKRLSDSGRAAFDLAQQAVKEDSQMMVTSPQIVAALLDLPDGHGQAALRELGVEDPAKLAHDIRQYVEHQDRNWEASCPPWQFNFSPHCQNILRLAVFEAEREGETLVSDRHLLLGVLRDGEGIAIRFLIERGVGLARMRALLAGSEELETAEGDVEEPLLDKHGRLNLARLDQTAHYILDRSIRESQAIGDYLTSTPYLFVAMAKLENGFTQAALQAQSHDPRHIRNVIRKFMSQQKKVSHSDVAGVVFSKRALDILENADALARQEGSRTGERHLLIAFLGSGGGVTGDLLHKMGVDLAMMETQVVESSGLPTDMTSSLNRWGRNLTRLAQAKQLDPVIGREEELSQVIEVLSQREAPNPLLVGQAGVGKTAIVEGVAQRFASDKVPASLKGCQVIELSVNTLVKGCRLRGEFEERLDRVLQEAQEAGIILFFDEAHTLVGAGTAGLGKLDAANILKPALAGGDLRCIGATTLSEYRQSIERDAALARRFQLIRVEEPSTDETFEILSHTRYLLEDHHRVRISDEALGVAIKFSDMYLPEKRQPAKSRTLVDQASAWVNTHNVKGIEENTDREDWPELDTEAIARIVTRETGIPLTTLTATEAERLQQLESELQNIIIGQDQAIQAVVRVIKQGRAGMKDPNHPLGTLLFVGPTGVGKTALACALAKCLFGAEGRLIRLDMSEFAESHAVAKLIGAPPGYIGHEQEGQLSGPLRHRPYSIVLLDEVEKAHPDVWNLFLQLFEEGRLTDASGRQVNGRNAIFILTSNVGTDLLQKRRIGFQGMKDDYEHIQETIKQELKGLFRPEFLGRIDDIIIFSQLSKSNVQTIVQLQMDDLAKLAAEREITLCWDEDVISLLAVQGYSQEYGVRHLEQVIDRLVKEPLTELSLTGARGVYIAQCSEHGTIVLNPDIDAGSDSTSKGNQNAHH